MNKDSAIDIKCEKIRILGEALAEKTTELEFAKEEIHLLKFKLAKQKGKNKKAGSYIAQLKQELKRINENGIRMDKLIPEPASMIFGFIDEEGRVEQHHISKGKVEVKQIPPFRSYCEEEKYMCGYDTAGYDIKPTLFSICKKAGLAPINVCAEYKTTYKPFDELIKEIETETDNQMEKAKGDDLILLGMAKTFIEMVRSNKNFEINIINEEQTGFLGQKGYSGRKIATIKYFPTTGNGFIYIKGG